MSADSNGGLVIHGRSFAFLMDDVSLTELNELLEQWKGITFDPNEYKNGDRHELDNR